MRIISYNVNGLRAAINKGFTDWLATDPADVICLQETKAQEHQLADAAFRPEGYNAWFKDAQKKRYEESLEHDFSFCIRGQARFRCNLFVDRLGMGGVFRVIPHRILTAEEMGLLGISVTDTIVVYDRIRENLKKYRKMEIVPLLNLSINETLSRTVRTMGWYTVAVTLVSFALIPLNDMGVVYSVAAVVLGIAFIALTFGLGRAPTTAAAMRVFTFSISYVTLLFLAVMLDVLVR